jgi:hypothetical protein
LAPTSIEGSPATPSAFVHTKLVEPAVKVRAALVFAAVLATMPLDAGSSM